MHVCKNCLRLVKTDVDTSASVSYENRGVLQWCPVWHCYVYEMSLACRYYDDVEPF